MADDLKRLLEEGLLETRRHFDAVAERVEKKSDANVAELRGHIDTSVERVEKKFDASVAELHRHFDVSTESLKKEIRLVAEAVAQLEEKGDREHEDIREEMRRGFDETQAMIKFSHAELDRRVRTLEQAFADLQARVERLETTIH